MCLFSYGTKIYNYSVETAAGSRRNNKNYGLLIAEETERKRYKSILLRYPWKVTSKMSHDLKTGLKEELMKGK